MEPVRIAVVATVYHYLSHAQHITDRFLVGYPLNGSWRRPQARITGMYVDQKPANDLSGQRAREYNFRVYPTIQEALRAGGKQLACDAVLIIGEHGNYERNEKGQVLYPRYEFFRQCAEVFEEDGRVAPVYCDKHLSYSFEKARAMVETSRRLRFPMLAGSSLPVTWRLPDVEMPYGAVIEDALMVGNGGSDVMDFHALEALQCMVERRRGGETGVRSVQLLEGDAVWSAGENGVWSKDLLRSALSRSDTPQGLTLEDGRTQDLVASGQLRVLVKRPAAYLIEHRDGLRTALLMLDGAVKDFTFAARVRGLKRPLSTQFFLSPVPNVTYSACLVSKIEEMFLSGQPPYPVERTLLVSGVLENCLDSKLRGNQRLETPHLDVHYRGQEKSQYCRS